MKLNHFFRTNFFFANLCVSESSELEAIKMKLVEEQLAKSDRIVAELVLTTPELQRSELDDYVRDLKQSLVKEFSRLGLKSDLTIQVRVFMNGILTSF